MLSHPTETGRPKVNSSIFTITKVDIDTLMVYMKSEIAYVSDEDGRALFWSWITE